MKSPAPMARVHVEADRPEDADQPHRRHALSAQNERTRGRRRRVFDMDLIESCAMNSTLSERLRAYSELLALRADLEFQSKLVIREPEGAPADFPADVRALAEGAASVEFGYAGPNDAYGFAALTFYGEAMPTYMEIDGEEVPEEQLFVFDGDLMGTGQAAWLVMRPDRPRILWSVEDMISFSSAEEYITAGAKAAFQQGWQRDFSAKRPAYAPLASVSLSRETPTADIEAALVARGASPAMAADLLVWLGPDAALLVPA